MSTDGSAVAERPTASSEPVLYQVSDVGVALITLNRPERRNAWGGALTSVFFRCLEDAEVDDFRRERRSLAGQTNGDIVGPQDASGPARFAGCSEHPITS